MTRFDLDGGTDKRGVYVSCSISEVTCVLEVFLFDLSARIVSVGCCDIRCRDIRNGPDDASAHPVFVLVFSYLDLELDVFITIVSSLFMVRAGFYDKGSLTLTSLIWFHVV